MIIAGILPGAEFARRRRFRQDSRGSTNARSCIRRSSFCHYVSGHETHPSCSRFEYQQTKVSNREKYDDGALGTIAKEAKERLDARLSIKRHNSLGTMKNFKTNTIKRNGLTELKYIVPFNVHRDVFCRRKMTRRFSWSKLVWKCSEQLECAVCLEEFNKGDILMQLQCDHRFHWNCAAPWLESNSNCPCCRGGVSIQ